MKIILKLTIITILISLLSINISISEEFSAYKNNNIEKRPQQTPADNIAMTFYKIAGIIPNFRKITESTSEYKNAAAEDKFYIRDRGITKLKNIYNLITAQEPIVIEVKVKLSDYSYSNKGFFIQDFDEGTFFPIENHGINYAVVPIGIMDKQWLKSPNLEISQIIQDFNKASKEKNLSVILYLTPKYADSSKTINIGNKDYWIMGVSIDRLMLFLPNYSTPIWSSESPKTGQVNERLQQLLNLRE